MALGISRKHSHMPASFVYRCYMNKQRIIIEYDNDVVGPCEATRRVADVISQGRISEAGGVLHYCWLTTFINHTRVATKRKKKGQKSDSFLVFKGKNK